MAVFQSGNLFVMELFCKVLSKQVVSDPKVRVSPTAGSMAPTHVPTRTGGVAITPPQYEQTQTYVRQRASGILPPTAPGPKLNPQSLH